MDLRLYSGLRLWMAGLLLLMISGPALAQTGYTKTRQVRGTVTSSGVPLEHAVVKLKNVTTLQIRSYITRKDGSYHFAGLNSDVTYEVTAQHAGYEQKNQEVSKFDSSNPAIVNFDLARLSTQ